MYLVIYRKRHTLANKIIFRTPSPEEKLSRSAQEKSVVINLWIPMLALTYWIYKDLSVNNLDSTFIRQARHLNDPKSNHPIAINIINEKEPVWQWLNLRIRVELKVWNINKDRTHNLQNNLKVDATPNAFFRALNLHRLGQINRIWSLEHEFSTYIYSYIYENKEHNMIVNFRLYPFISLFSTYFYYSWSSIIK